MVNEVNSHLKVFLCHASGDKPAVHELYKRLVAEGVDAWLDKENLLPGQDWSLEIPRAVRASDVVVICLSKRSITKEGYVQTEITFALDIAKEKPEGTIFLIPTRLEECIVPDRLNRWQWVDLFNENGFEQLMRSLRVRADKIGAALENSSYIDTELKQRIDQLYTEGSAAIWLEDWDKACYCFQTILRYMPNEMEASRKLEEAKRQKQLFALYTQALDAQKSEDWNAMVEVLEKLTNEVAEYKDAPLLLKDAQRKNRLTRLYEEAHKLYKAEQWQAVVRVFEHIAMIEPDFQDPDGLLALAENKVAELKRLNELNILYRQGVREMDSGRWPEAYELFKHIQNAEHNFLETERLLAKVEIEVNRAAEKQRREDQINLLYEQARRLFRTRRWREAIDKVHEIRNLDEQFADPDQIVRQSEIELENQEREIERQTKAATLYNEAVSLMREKKYQGALEKWQELVILDPEYPDPQNVQLISKKRLGELTKSPLPNQKAVRTRLIWVGFVSFVAITLLAMRWLIPFAAGSNLPTATVTTPVMTNSPTPLVGTITSVPPIIRTPQFSGPLTISSTTIPGLSTTISQTGFYRLEYRGGAWAAWQAPDSSNDNRWSTNLFCFRGEEIIWDNNALNGENAVFALIGNVFPNAGLAQIATQVKRSAIFYLQSGDHLSCVVADGKTDFSDNSGEVVLNMYYLSAYSP